MKREYKKRNSDVDNKYDINRFSRTFFFFGYLSTLGITFQYAPTHVLKTVGRTEWFIQKKKYVYKRFSTTISVDFHIGIHAFFLLFVASVQITRLYTDTTQIGWSCLVESPHPVCGEGVRPSLLGDVTHHEKLR